MKVISLLLCIIFLGISGLADNDPDCLEKIKTEYSSSAMIQFEATLSVYSFVFEDTEKYPVVMTVSDSGLYRVKIGGDIYLYNGRRTYEYSAENNQATYREVGPGEKPFDRISFIKNFDRYYHTETIEPCRVYKLNRFDSAAESLPEKMTLFLEKGKLWRVEYKDLNDDLNTFEIKKENLFKNFDQTFFEADFPDSTEFISLP